MRTKQILFLFLFLPLFMFSQENVNSPQAPENSSTENTKNISEPLDSGEEKLNEQIEFAKNILKNINDEFYLSTNFNEINYSSQINYLETKIDANERANNELAMVRDQIAVLKIKEERFFYNTLKELTNAKKLFKDKEYFENVLNNNIELLKQNSVDKFKTFYESEKSSDNYISNELVKNYIKLQEQNSQQLFTLNYLKENLSSIRVSNFFVDKFNLQYLSSIIDSYPVISTLSDFSSYYLKVSIGDIVIVLAILLIFKLFIAKIIHILITVLKYIIIKSKKNKKDEKDDEDIDEEESLGLETYLEESIEKPLLIALYTLSIHISIYILIKDPELLNKIIPWLNTFYLGITTWAVYSLLTNSISNYAQHLVETHPNVRREMIVFIMRIIKIILILLVILFLFTQLGIDIKAIAASLGVGGIAIALASKDTLANFFGSLSIMIDNSFSQGDWIVVNDIEGTVVDIRMRTTRIRTFDNAMITVPNSEIANAHIKNYTKRKIGRRIKMTLGATYENKIEDIVNLKHDIYEMLTNHPGIATEKEHIVRKSKKFEGISRDDLHGVKRNLMVYVDEYGASSVNIMVYCFTRSPDWEDWLAVKEDVIVKIHKLFEKNNCDFAYPTQTLHLKK
ncbi:mechanosensitive ion channel domain-containing protein [Arcobacter arenosus]|uniref:mechanosensitive ion channel family protein n=1 Tax=Arcobacter arenosus TaxID=2576037 RepID=UPI003BA9B8BA